MKNIDMRSFIIGILSSICLLLFFGHTKETDEITCRRLTIVNDEGKEIVILASSEAGNGYIHTANVDEVINTKITNGKIWNFNKFGSIVSYAGQSTNGDGMFYTNNKYESQTTYMGSNTSNAGLIAVSGKNGNRTASIYSSDGSGSLTIKNNIDNQIVYLGATEDDEGFLKLNNKDGDKRLTCSNGAIQTYNDNNKAVAYLGSSTANNGLIIIGDEEIESGLTLTSTELTIKHNSEIEALTLGTGYMFMYNTDGTKRTYLGYNVNTNDGLFNIYDKRGNIIFTK